MLLSFASVGDHRCGYRLAHHRRKLCARLHSLSLLSALVDIDNRSVILHSIESAIASMIISITTIYMIDFVLFVAIIKQYVM
jgi:hypothetical protein